jgi:vacuolar-type H+-ATPase subunit C/Vma6
LIARVFRYSFAQARARSLKGKLLSSEDWHYLSRMKSVEDLLRYLAGTGYGPGLARLAGAEPHPGGVVPALYEELFRDYGKLLNAVPTTSGLLLRGLLARYEGENLKTILGGVWQGRRPSEIRPLLYGLGALSRLPFEELLGSREVAAAIELLKPSLFHAALRNALPQFQAQGRLFPLEMAIDRAALEQVAEAAKTLGGLDRRGAEELLGEWVDGINLSWVVRFRHFYGLSAEEVINYTLKGGRRLGLRVLGRLARAADLPSFLEALPASYREALGRAQHWVELQDLLDRRFVDALHGIFRRDPFQIGLPLSYLLLKEHEVKSLESLLSAARMAEQAGSPAGWVAPPERGQARVQV